MGAKKERANLQLIHGLVQLLYVEVAISLLLELRMELFACGLFKVRGVVLSQYMIIPWYSSNFHVFSKVPNYSFIS